MNNTLRSILALEFKLLARNPLVWFRFVLFYLVFTAVMARATQRSEWETLSITTAGLMVVAAVGITNSLAAVTFAREKERRTMEALLLAPTSAAGLLRAKLIHVAITALCGVLCCFVTGVILVLALHGPSALRHAVNRVTLATALVACPPAILATGSLGIMLSCRSRSLQTATNAGALSSMAGMVIVLTIAYVIATKRAVVAAPTTAAAWSVALFAYRTAHSVVSPNHLIRSRGR